MSKQEKKKADSEGYTLKVQRWVGTQSVALVTNGVTAGEDTTPT